MANTIKRATTGAPYWNLDTTATSAPVSFGTASDDAIGSFSLHVVGLTAAGASLTLKGRAVGSEVTGAGFTSLAYRNATSGADVAGTTAITADGIYRVPADGIEVLGAFTAGSAAVQVYFRGMRG